MRVLQDCAQAAGAKIGRRFVGATGDACLLSFYATKLLTCGEGGMLLSNSRALIEDARDLREYDNKIPDKVRDNAKPGDLQSAIGREQLKNLDSFLARRAAIAGIYDGLLAGADLILPPRRPGRIYCRYVVRLRKPAAGRVIARLEALAIQARRPVFRPLHFDVPARGRFPNSETAYACCLSLPIHPLISDKDAARIGASLQPV